MEEGWKVKEKSIPQLESISPWHMGGPWLSPHNRPLHHPDRRAAECTSKAITGQKWGEVTQATAFRPLHNSPTTTMSIQKQWNYSSWESDNMLFKKHLWRGGKKKTCEKCPSSETEEHTKKQWSLLFLPLFIKCKTSMWRIYNMGLMGTIHPHWVLLCKG